MNDKDKIVFETSKMLVQHIRECMNSTNRGVHSRIFSILLHPEENFVLVGQSKAVIDGEPKHPEHIVPCAFIIAEARKLIEKEIADERIAALIAKHWKIVYISKKEAEYLDGKNGLNLKSVMPSDWSFEVGDSFARLNLAGIKLFPI